MGSGLKLRHYFHIIRSNYFHIIRSIDFGRKMNLSVSEKFTTILRFFSQNSSPARLPILSRRYSPNRIDSGNFDRIYLAGRFRSSLSMGEIGYNGTKLSNSTISLTDWNYIPLFVQRNKSSFDLSQNFRK